MGDVYKDDVDDDKDVVDLAGAIGDDDDDDYDDGGWSMMMIDDDDDYGGGDAGVG